MANKINAADLKIIDVDGQEIVGAEREKKLQELRRDGTMLDAWIEGEDWENDPFTIVW